VKIFVSSSRARQQQLKAKIDSKAQTAEQVVRTQLETVKEQDRNKLA